MNARRFKVHGITDEPGHCDLCGTYCPRRRVAVELVTEDGSTTGDVQLWGVVCAAEARHGRRDATLARQLRDEAEEAGAYSGPARGHRRGARPAVRRQTRHQAARLAAMAAADERIIWTRSAAPVPDAYQTATGVDGAAYRYRLTGRRTGAAYFAVNDAGRLAVIDGADVADVARFERAGFRPSPWGQLHAWTPDVTTA